MTPPVFQVEMWPYVVLSPAHHALAAAFRVSDVNAKQLVAPPVAYVPAGQASSQLVCPTSTPKKPPPQRMQVSSPSFGWYVPGAQGKHEAWPSAGLYVPGAHGSQLMCPVDLDSLNKKVAER